MFSLLNGHRERPQAKWYGALFYRHVGPAISLSRKWKQERRYLSDVQENILHREPSPTEFVDVSHPPPLYRIKMPLVVCFLSITESTSNILYSQQQSWCTTSWEKISKITIWKCIDLYTSTEVPVPQPLVAKSNDSTKSNLHIMTLSLLTSCPTHGTPRAYPCCVDTAARWVKARNNNSSPSTCVCTISCARCADLPHGVLHDIFVRLAMATRDCSLPYSNIDYSTKKTYPHFLAREIFKRYKTVPQSNNIIRDRTFVKDGTVRGHR